MSIGFIGAFLCLDLYLLPFPFVLRVDWCRCRCCCCCRRYFFASRWRSNLLNKDNETNLNASARVWLYFLLLFLLYSSKTIAINLNGVLCNKMKRMQNFKQSNDLSILPDVYVEFVCQSHTVFVSSVSLGQNIFEEQQKKIKIACLIAVIQIRAFYSKEICHRYFSLLIVLCLFSLLV